MRILHQEQLLTATRLATTAWQAYNDAPTVENFERRERAMGELAKVVAEIERERGQ